MPLVQVFFNIPKPENAGEVSLALSKIMGEATGKPEAVLMVHANWDQDITFARSTDPAVLVKFSCIGKISDEENQKYAKALSDYFKETLDIDKERVFLVMTDVDAANWGWQGSTVQKLFRE